MAPQPRRRIPHRVTRFLDGHLAPVLVVLLGGTSVVGVLRYPVTALVLCVWIPLGVLSVLLIPAGVFPSWERRWGSRMAGHGAFVLSVASAGLGGILVALAVLSGVLDASVWAALSDADRLVEFLVTPTFTWFATLSVAVWAFVGYGVHAGVAWGALRRTAAGVAFTAALALPLLVPVVGYQVWRLVDARIAVGQPGLTPAADATTTTSLANGQTPPTTTPPTADPSAGTRPPTTGAPVATTLLSPPERGWGVVLIDPLIDDSLNLREWPGVDGPVLATLHRTQSGLRPTGRVSPVAGRPWYEVTTPAGITGWVHGRYVTPLVPATVARSEWDWKGAVDRFAQALGTNQSLLDSVSWRGLYAVDGGGGLHWWRPSDVPTLANDTNPLRWNFAAATWEDTGLIHTFADVIAAPFLSDYHDPDVQLSVGALPLGAGAVLPTAAVSPAFANFVWIAVHDPADNPDFGGLDWRTWLIYLELDGDTPKVVGVQEHGWVP